MESIIMLTINGNIFLFQDNGITLEDKICLENIAEAITLNHQNQNSTTEKEIGKKFTDEVKSCLGLNLLHIPISYVLRINSNS